MPSANYVDYTSTFYGGLTDTDVAPWCFLRDAGGYWSAKELIAQALPDMGGHANMFRRIQRLCDGGHVAHKKAAFQNQPDLYGVTAKCSPPQRESLTPQPLATPEQTTEEALA